MKYIVFCLFLLLSSPIFSSQYENKVIDKIEIVLRTEHATINKDAIKAKLKTKQKMRFSQQEFDADLKTLAEEFDRVESSFRIENQELILHFDLWVKPIIRTISFEGNEHIKAKKLRKTLDIEAGVEFDRDNFVTALNQLRALYIKKGFFQAQITYSLLPVPGFNEADVVIQIEEGVCGKIANITFSGLSSREESELEELMLTQKYYFFISMLSQRGYYHPDMIEHDRMTLINYFQNRGFADAQVTITVAESQKKNRIDVEICIDKGRQYRFGSICIEGNVLFDTNCILDALTFDTNYAYSPEALRLSVQAIQTLYGCKGYIDTTVDMALSLREGEAAYDVTILIEEAEQHYVGLIRVFGNTYTQNRVILHESLLCPGELFDNRKLEATERRILNTGLFGCANVYAVESQIESDDCSFRDLYIEVEEADTGNLGLFGGFSSMDRLFGGIELTERNFNLLGITALPHRGLNAMRGGGEYLHLKANIGDRQTSYTLQWSKPYFLDTPWILGVELERSTNRVMSNAYTLKTYGGSLHTTYIWNGFLKYDIYYRARHSGINILDEENFTLEQQADHTGLISASGLSLIYDSTDHPRCPSRGLRSRLSYELAGLGGNFQFMRWSYLNSCYYPLSRKGTLKFRADFNFIHTYGNTTASDLPLTERLFMGGDTSVRGYRQFIIGPKTGPNQPVGGVSSYLLSEEYQHHLLKSPCLDGFIFVDAGYCSQSEFTIGRFAASTGLGIRVEILRGMPMTFGIGWPIHPTETITIFTEDPINKTLTESKVRVDNSQRFFFSMGGNF